MRRVRRGLRAKFRRGALLGLPTAEDQRLEGIGPADLSSGIEGPPDSSATGPLVNVSARSHILDA